MLESRTLDIQNYKNNGSNYKRANICVFFIEAV